MQNSRRGPGNAPDRPRHRLWGPRGVEETNIVLNTTCRPDGAKRSATGE